MTFTEEAEERYKVLTILENAGYELIIEPDYSNTYYLAKNDKT